MQRLEKPLGEDRTKNVVPHRRPLLVFEGNTAHSSGYMWQRGACMYFGGKIWEDQNDGFKKYYSSGRHELETMTPDGQQRAFMILRNTKVRMILTVLSCQQLPAGALVSVHLSAACLTAYARFSCVVQDACV